jgi:hypothetical protein
VKPAKAAISALLAAAAVACLTARGTTGGSGVFRDVTASSGIRFRFRSDLRRLKMIATMNGGCAFGDADGDGRPDLYVTNSVPRWGKPNAANCGRLYRNRGKGRFEDVTKSSGIRACGLGMGAFWVDIDGDGDLDLYLTNVGANQLFVNRGDGTFEEARGSGLEDPLFSVGAAFLDYDADGDVDVVVANYLDSTPEWELKQPQFELRVPDDYVGQPSHLFRNDGGRFTDVTAAAGLAMPVADSKTLSVAVLDYDGDGRPDLYFVNDRTSNRLFRNKGDGTFVETTAEAGAGAQGAQPRAGMGVAVGDADGDGNPDVFVTNFGGEPNSYYRNVSGALFEEAGTTLGGGAVGVPSIRWGTDFADFDNDGWPDLYAVGGHLAPRIARIVGHYRSGNAAYVEAGDRGFRQKTVLLHNSGEGRLEEWRESGDLGAIRMAGRGSAVADVDGDGDLDLFVVDLAGPSRLFENEVGSRRSWIGIDPRPGPDRRTVLGTRVSVTSGVRTQTREFQVSESYASGTLTALHFGLGDASKVDVEVRWPGGETRRYPGVAARRLYRLTREGGLVEEAPAR